MVLGKGIHIKAGGGGSDGTGHRLDADKSSGKVEMGKYMFSSNGIERTKKGRKLIGEKY